MKVTRRTLARILAATAAVPLRAVPLAAVPQTPPPDSDEELKNARDRMRNDAALLGRFPLPKATEPAFRFKA
jgi:hypothetical protein